MYPSKSAMLIVVLSACVAPTEPSIPVQLAVQGSTFDRGAPIPFSITNAGGDSVFVDACGPRVTVFVERRVGRAWASYAGGACQAIYPFAPLGLAAGSSFEGSVQIPDAGLYRLRIGAGVDPRELGVVVSPSLEVH